MDYIDKDLHEKLKRKEEECARLREENIRLRKLLGIYPEGIISHSEQLRDKTQDNYSQATGNKLTVTNNSGSQEKVFFFRKLFRGREDVYAVRFESKAGKKGYSPACKHEWNRPICKKPTIKCSECDNRELLPLTDKVVYEHLKGEHTVGIYPLLPDETCRFLAVDFDKLTWQQDSLTFLNVCRDLDIPAALERSRSGNGGHIWIFFEEPVAAYLARNLGSIILTRTLQDRHQLQPDSYDRFFPNQDTLPKGGFGNLIALPLQKGPRAKGNSLFVDDNFEPYEDQWLLLSTLKKMKKREVSSIVQEEAKEKNIIEVGETRMEVQETPWLLTPSQKNDEKHVKGPFPSKIRIIQSNMLYIEKKLLPPSLLNRLIHTAAFQNPEYYKAQAMRLPTYNKPRMIRCAENYPLHIGLPRGCLEEVMELLETYSIEVEWEEARLSGTEIEVNFKGNLNYQQKYAALKMEAYDTGVLSASTAFGKTVVAAWLIAQRKTNTLVLVHRRQLLDQWKDRLAMFFDIPVQEIGEIGGGKNRLTGNIDIGIIQSLFRKGRVKDLIANYGFIIVDECHHVSAFSFEQVLKEAKARYVLGLTATPERKDGHHPIVMMQCGPIRYKVKDKKQTQARPFKHMVIPRQTSFELPSSISNPTIHDIYAEIIRDNERNQLIIKDLLDAVKKGRNPLLLSERREHLDYFVSNLEGKVQNLVVLKGGMGKRQREAVAEQLANIKENEERVIISTGRYIGEGFDDSRLDTLFLVMPVSWKGTLQQYVGRLHRLNDNKKEVRVYDYVDVNVPLLMKMYKKRLRGYKAIGYMIEGD